MHATRRALPSALASLSFLALGLLAVHADAQEAATHSHAAPLEPRLGFGARIGGYGFRDASGGSTRWDDCRMDGAGLFTTADLGQHAFGEVALDFYQAHADVVAEGMDRTSLHLQTAVGLRMLPDFYVSPYIQLGGGAEWTTLAMHATGQTFEGWRPSGFIGLGAEINVLDNLKLGAHLRMLWMAHPTHDHGDAHGDAHGTGHAAVGHVEAPAPAANAEAPMEFGAGGQAQFFIRYVL